MTRPPAELSDAEVDAAIRDLYAAGMGPSPLRDFRDTYIGTTDRAIFRAGYALAIAAPAPAAPADDLVRRLHARFADTADPLVAEAAAQLAAERDARARGWASAFCPVCETSMSGPWTDHIARAEQATAQLAARAREIAEVTRERDDLTYDIGRAEATAASVRVALRKLVAVVAGEWCHSAKFAAAVADARASLAALERKT